LPGVRYRRHVLGRYSLVWRKPQRNAVSPNIGLQPTAAGAILSRRG
jgi:hypothetical protein